MSNLFIASFDTLGFERIIDLTAHDKQAMWASLSEMPAPTGLPVHQMIMRAQLNPHRFPEIWTFKSELSEQELVEIAKDSPQALADLIRQEGAKVFVTPKEQAVIK